MQPIFCQMLWSCEDRSYAFVHFEGFIKLRKIACGYLALRCWCPHMHHSTC